MAENRFRLGRGQLLIAAGAIVWGTQGPFASLMMRGGASPILVAFLKLLIGGSLLMLWMGLTCPSTLKIDRQGFWLTALMGLCAQAGFNLVYYTSVSMIGIANAAVILYTSPIFFLLISIIWFKEAAALQKAVAAVLCFAGCGVAVTGGRLSAQGLSLPGVALALISALAFAFMGAMGKQALSRYRPLTIISYSFMWGALFLLPVALYQGAFQAGWMPELYLGALGIGVFPAALAYLLYFSGVDAGVPLSQAGVISALEMVSAVLIAWTLFGEAFSVAKAGGVVLILLSILLTEWRFGSVLRLSNTEEAVHEK